MQLVGEPRFSSIDLKSQLCPLNFFYLSYQQKRPVSNVTYPSLVSKLPNQPLEFIKVFIHLSSNLTTRGFPDDSDGKESACNVAKEEMTLILSEVGVFGGENET